MREEGRLEGRYILLLSRQGEGEGRRQGRIRRRPRVADIEGRCREGRKMAGSEGDRRVFREGSRDLRRRRDRGWSIEADIDLNRGMNCLSNVYFHRVKFQPSRHCEVLDQNSYRLYNKL